MSDAITATAQTGIQQGINGLKKNASQLASKAAMEGKADITTPVVEMKINKYQVLASGKVIETVDETLGALLNEKV